MPSPFVAKLLRGCTLTTADMVLLEDLTKKTRRLAAKRDIICEGERSEDVHLVLEGFACRYKVLPGGKRHITALLIPGDFCDPNVAILGAMDHSVGAITACTIVEIPRAAVEDLWATQPRIARALRWASLVDEAILRQWLVSMGMGQTASHLAHFLCELLARLEVVGLVEADSFDFPMTQADLADTLGSSSVHMNRSVQLLRNKNLISLQHRRLTVLDRPSLESFGDFDPHYLHLQAHRATAPEG